MIGIFSKILLNNEEIYLHIQNIFDTVLFGEKYHSNVEDAIAEQINNNLDEYMDPWWKQNEYVYRKCSFHFIDELLILDPDFCADFQRIYSINSGATTFVPRIKQASLVEKWKNKSVKAHLSGIFEVIFHFKDEEDSLDERNLMRLHLFYGMKYICSGDSLKDNMDHQVILEF